MDFHEQERKVNEDAVSAEEAAYRENLRKEEVAQAEKDFAESEARGFQRENKTERVTLAIAERSIEGAWCEGYRTGVFDMAAIALAALSVYAIVCILASNE